MSETIDPITILRDYFTQGKEITVSKGSASSKTGDQLTHVDLVFGDSGIKLPRDVQTAWARKDGKGFYNAGAIYFLLANPQLKN